jgi:glucose/arabinose dehydrogenase
MNRIGALLAVSSVLVGLAAADEAKLDTRPLEVKIERAFPELKFRRPIMLTHAGDGTNRVFIAEQYGKIHVLPNDQQASQTQVFLDLEPKVTYQDKQNEEGFLGLAFHPRYKDNGELFVYYSTREEPQLSIISRFRVSKDDPNRADPNSEEELMRIKQPYWNHNGGTLVFGPDGYLYIGLGDGGSANDPHGHGQNLSTLLGSILRIDVDRKDPGLNYAIPQDNPFVSHPDARPEIHAYGLRNVWRMAFDPKTGQLWAADVGQDTWEEINLILAGGNYGWNRREGFHPFIPKKGEPVAGHDSTEGLIDPIWEYHHDVGKSITGGTVYRGKRVPQLAGAYLYADYVTGKVWALWYDAKSQRVIANREIPGNTMPVLSFGEDEQGEVYFLTDVGTIHRFAPAEEAPQK